jgi:MoCo/4Fe-4S cofactor protein with predicted Tat translocation signal
MSCDDNKKAEREAGKRQRSLPIVSHAPEEQAPAVAAQPRLLRSLEELEGSPAWRQAAAREFPPGASELPDGVSRRSFVRLMGTTAAVAGIGVSCRKPNEKIVPFVRRPPEMTPGNPQYFATAYSLEGFGAGLLVESHEGRPTKVEGNPDHPDNRGASTTFEQALILGLYDDHRMRQLTRDRQPIAWRSLLTDVSALGARLAADGGAKLRFLTEPSSSPLLGDLRRRILERFPKAKFVSYAPLEVEASGEGARLAFGRNLQVRHRLDKAAVILSLESDFLGDGPEQTRLTREFSAAREPGPGMNRLYVVEPAMTVTGTMADHRLRLRGSDVAAFALGLITELANRPGFGSLAPLASLGRSGPPGAWDGRWMTAVARDLERNRGRCLIIAGRRQSPAVHALAAALNLTLGNIGNTVTYSAPVLNEGANGVAALGALAEDIAAGAVDTLVITATNPVYTAPVDFKLGALLARVPNTIYHALHEDETAAVCRTVVPASHTLESWGDTRATDGTVSIIQPLIAPLWGGMTEAEVLAAFVGEGDIGAHQLVRRYWQGRVTSTDFDSDWERWLADGVVPSTADTTEERVAVDVIALATVLTPLLARKTDGFEIAFAVDPKVHDGRFANNAWLQELPHPITKVTWDNAAWLSPATAAGLGLVLGDRIEIEYRQRKLQAPVMIVPGHVDEAVSLGLGYGRAGAEEIARGVGFNAGQLRCSDAPWFDRGVSISKISGKYKFAITQDHWTMSPDGRDIPPPAVATTLASLLKTDSEFHEHVSDRRGPDTTIHKPVDYSGEQYKWAMAIDLNKCTGCSACVVACQSENNIPVVGKENVFIGREMQWLRIDRYFTGSMEEPEVITQPLACVHCETAPCEYVCPVNATVHSDEGLNEMVYNRCIGTRYCSNNCPYKVRRFNFFEYNGEVSGARQMGMNPDVTVRSRGIMEKCTYCVQRIERKRIDTRIAGRAIADGELVTACQQGCPAGAITFGSLNDPEAKVTKLHANPRRYDLLHEIGTRPRTAYLARVRNVNPELARVE